MPKVAMVAALEREVAPLTRQFIRRETPGQPFAVFERADVRLVCGGMGTARSALATRWLVADAKPEIIISIGFAGGLVPGCRVGEIVVPAEVLDAASGESFSVAAGEGLLVTTSDVVGEAEKRKLAARHRAKVVDMEASAVARVARENGIPFFAVKVISDEVGFAMPPLQQFFENGQVRTGKLLLYAAVRPSLWPALMRLGTNAKKASSQLCGWLENQISRDFHGILDVCGNAQR